MYSLPTAYKSITYLTKFFGIGVPISFTKDNSLVKKLDMMKLHKIKIDVILHILRSHYKQNYPCVLHTWVVLVLFLPGNRD